MLIRIEIWDQVCVSVVVQRIVGVKERANASLPECT
jgi:hypothetical protein